MPIQKVDRSERPKAPTDVMPEQMIAQLQPFNEFRFDDCIAFLAARHNHPLSTYEMMKLHVMIDVHHTLSTAMPVIGGDIWPFKNGPVARGAKHRVADWIRRYEEAGEIPEGFKIIDQGERYLFEPERVPDEDDFSKSELAAMELAWREVVPVLGAPDGFLASQAFFHKDSPIGVAWGRAWMRETALDWNEIVDAYAAVDSGLDRSAMKTMMRF